MEPRTCSSCGTNSLLSKSFVTFLCPSCGKTTISRCGRCKVLGRAYVCTDCGFEGP